MNEMTASEFASLLQAKRSSKGKWTAKCPSHDDRTPSLAIGEGRKGIVLKCMSQGCATKDILDALGLTWGDLFRGASDKELGGRVKLERLQRQHDLMRLMLVLDPRKRAYWQAGIRRVMAEMEPLYWEVTPDQGWFDRIREFDLKQAHVTRLDWLRERESNGTHYTTRSSGSSTEEVRRHSLHRSPHQLLPSWARERKQAGVQHRRDVGGGD